MNEDTDIMTETPEEKAFFDSRGAETVTVNPEPKPEVIVEPKPEAAVSVEVEEPTGKTTVPLAVLLEERREYKAKMDKLLERFDKLQEIVQPKAPAEQPADPDIDPIGALKELREWKAQNETQQKTQAEIQEIAGFGQRAAQAFREQKPDFDDAYNHLRHARANQLMESGRVETPEALNQAILSEEKEMIAMCARMGISPAALMYNLASAVGYAPKQAVPAPTPAPAAPTTEEKIKMAAEAQARASNPVNKAGSGTNAPIDFRAIASLDDDEFDKATTPAQWRKLMGG